MGPLRSASQPRGAAGSAPGFARRPPALHWTPTLALSISISFLSQYVSRWRPMQDRCFNIGSALTYNNYRSVGFFSLFISRTLRRGYLTPSVPPCVSPTPHYPRCKFVSAVFGGGFGGEFRTSPRIDESGSLSLSLADQKLILFVQSASIGRRGGGRRRRRRRRGDAPRTAGFAATVSAVRRRRRVNKQTFNRFFQL